MMFWSKPRANPDAIIGPDGMTDYSREQARIWNAGRAATDKLWDAIAERLGVDAEVARLCIPTDLLVAAVLLDVRLGDGGVE